MEYYDILINYLEGVFGAKLGISQFSCRVTDYEIDTAKKYAERIMESRIEEDITLTADQKEDRKRQMRKDLDAFIQGVKDTLKANGGLIESNS